MKKLVSLILFCFFESCVMDPQGDLQVKMVNLSKHKVYVGELGQCDSCGIMQDVRLYCTAAGKDTTYFPRLLNDGDSTIMWTKSGYISEKIDVINADSLEEYCTKGCSYNITHKKWAQVLIEEVDLKKKTCRFVIR